MPFSKRGGGESLKRKGRYKIGGSSLITFSKGIFNGRKKKKKEEKKKRGDSIPQADSSTLVRWDIIKGDQGAN